MKIHWYKIAAVIGAVLASGYFARADLMDGAMIAGRNFVPPNVQAGSYPISVTDCFRSMVQVGTGTTAQSTITLPSFAYFPNGCIVKVKNGDVTTSGHGMSLSGFPSDLNSILWPQQVTEVVVTPSGWQTSLNPGRWRLTSTVNMYVRPDGNDSNDGLANSSGSAFLTANAAFNSIANNIDINQQTLNVNHTCSSPPCSITTNNQLLMLVNVFFTGGVPSYKGDCTTPTNVKLNPGSAQQADIQSTFSSEINVCGFELAGGANLQYGIYVSGGGTRLNVNGPMQCDAMSSSNSASAPAGDCFLANSQGNIYLQTATMTWAGSLGAVFASLNGGLIENATGLTLTASGTPACSGSCAYAELGGMMNFPSLTNSGSSTGPRFQVGFGGEINTGTGSCAVAQTYFPGNSNGTISDATGNRGNCF